VRIGRCFAVQGEKVIKTVWGREGDLVAIAKLEGVGRGEWIGGANCRPAPVDSTMPPTMSSRSPQGAQGRCAPVLGASQLCEEDPAFPLGAGRGAARDAAARVGDEHIKVTTERLKRRYGVA
jgi:hypothetical protein